MEPIPFHGVNIVFGKDQPEYQTLPAYRTPDGTVVTCWKLSGEEMMMVLQTGMVWFSQLTAGGSLQPILPSIEMPKCLEGI